MLSVAACLPYKKIYEKILGDNSNEFIIFHIMASEQTEIVKHGSQPPMFRSSFYFSTTGCLRSFYCLTVNGVLNGLSGFRTLGMHCSHSVYVISMEIE